MRRKFIVFTIFAAIAIATVAPLAVRAQGASPVASPAAGIVEATVDVDGRSLHLACAGDATSGPAVLFEPGGPFLDGGTAVVAAIGSDLAAALGTRFCSYDRAGTGLSDPHPMGVRTFEEAAADLRAVLASPELACPCVVVGESLGGSIALVALAEDSAGIGGLVLLDPPYPGYIDQFFSLTAAGSPETGPEFMAYNEGENEERLDVFAGFRQVTVPAQPPAIPIVVVTHGAGYPPPCSWEPPCSDGVAVEELETAWQAGQQELGRGAGSTPRGRRGHQPHDRRREPGAGGGRGFGGNRGGPRPQHLVCACSNSSGLNPAHTGLVALTQGHCERRPS